MFTGLIRGSGRVLSVARHGRGWRLRLAARGAWGKAGDSVAVDGCCLTLAEPPAAGILAFDAVPETWRLTTLPDRRPGDRVNLERPLRWGEALHGHLVLGHVDARVRILRLRRAQRETRLRVALPASLAGYAARKGSVALDGVSLTIAALGRGWLETALIPETLKRTTLGGRRPGDRVNLEMDALAKLAGRPRRLVRLLSPVRPTRRARSGHRGRSTGARRAGRS